MCQCNQTRELDEYGQQYEGDFVEDFEAILGDLAGETDFEGDFESDFEAESDFEGEEEVRRSKRYGGLRLQGEGEAGYDFETGGGRYGDLYVQGEQDESEGEEEIYGLDQRKRVLFTKRAPFRYICNLEYDIPGLGRWAMGSGTLIGPRTVLTAGHCIVDDKGALLDPKRMRIIPGRNGTLEPLAATAATNFVLFPGFAEVTGTDVGIIHLADPIGKSVGFWTRAYAKNKGDHIGTSIIPGALPLPAGKLKVNVSGYPGDMPGGKKHGCRRPKTNGHTCRPSYLDDKNRTKLCGTQQYRAYDVTVAPVAGDKRLLRYITDTCAGHSGSPVWVRRHPSKGGRVLTAVHVGRRGSTNVAVFLDADMRKFIVSNTK